MHDKKLTWFSYGVIAFVTMVAVAGVVLVGFPNDERARRFDERRVSDLQQIDGQIVSYWQRSGLLPTNLDSLTDRVSGFIVPSDPESGVPYKYRTVASTTFELCAMFTAERMEKANIMPYGMAEPRSVESMLWNHDAGRQCFTRIINPSLYPPVKPPVATGGCVITGCSGQVCAEGEVATTCEFRSEYACYKQYSRCERQTDGQCGWTNVPELSRCLSATPRERPMTQ